MSFWSTLGDIGKGALDAAPVLGQVANSISQSSMNKKTREFQEKMWYMQRDQDLANWNMSNEYNSPTSQMKRLKDAGLNPYMVYGNPSSMSGGNASPPNAPSAPTWNPRSVDPGNAMLSAYDARMKAVQVDNLKEQNRLLAAQTFKTVMDGSQGEFDLGMKKQLEGTSLEVAKIALDKAKSDSTIAGSEAKWRDTLLDVNAQRGRGLVDLNEADLGLKQLQSSEMKERIMNLRRSGALQDFEIQMNKNGMTKSDPMYFRMLATFLSKFGISLK